MFTISPDGRYLVAVKPVRPARGNAPAVTTPATAIPLDGSPRIPLLASVQFPSAPVVSLGAGPKLVVVTNWWSEARTKLSVR